MNSKKEEEKRNILLALLTNLKYTSSNNDCWQIIDSPSRCSIWLMRFVIVLCDPKDINIFLKLLIQKRNKRIKLLIQKIAITLKKMTQIDNNASNVYQFY